MRLAIHVRSESPADAAAVRRVNLAAFGRPDEAGLVERLRADGLVVASLVAEVDRDVVGHALFSRLPVRTDTAERQAVALAPMAVIPELQRKGIGGVLTATGLDRCRAAGERLVIVLGHPGYYPRFGFDPALAARLRGPFSGEAFMAVELVPRAIDEFAGGEVRYPPAFGLNG